MPAADSLRGNGVPVGVGIETTQMRARYRQAIAADAASALADDRRSHRSTLPGRRRAAIEQLAYYTGLVESADAKQPAEVRGRFLVLPRGVG